MPCKHYYSTFPSEKQPFFLTKNAPQHTQKHSPPCENAHGGQKAFPPRGHGLLRPQHTHMRTCKSDRLDACFLLQRRFGKSFPRRKAQRRQSDKQKQTQLSSFLHRQTRLTASPKNTLSLFPAEIQQNRNGDQCREADGSQRSGQNASFRRRFGNRFALRGRSGF